MANIFNSKINRLVEPEQTAFGFGKVRKRPFELFCPATRYTSWGADASGIQNRPDARPHRGTSILSNHIVMGQIKDFLMYGGEEGEMLRINLWK
jgi:hypothetical protein